MMRAYWAWRLRSEEAYLRTLIRGGWPESVCTAVSRHCEALRVKLALSAPMDRADVIAVSGSLAALAALGVIVCL